MSCQRGSNNRSRPQKHQNCTSFKNNLHDKSQKTKLINSIEVTNVCERCKKIIEWKIKYKKYKTLKALAKCTKCEQKTVRHSYHNICLPCARQQEVCPKCGQKKEIVIGKSSREEQVKLDAEFKTILETLSERKRRAFLRCMNQQSNIDVNKADSNDRNEAATSPKKREDLLTKLKSLVILDDENIDIDTDDESDNVSFNYDVDNLSYDEESAK